MKKRKIARCSKCHKVIVLQAEENAPLCCDEPMEILKESEDIAKEDTHLPVIARKDGKIYAYAGAYEHPMIPEHYIEWMILETETDDRIVWFHPGEEPKVPFLDKEAVIRVYAYCTKDGLWMTEI
jgi:Desulfoferrodoxin